MENFKLKNRFCKWKSHYLVMVSLWIAILLFPEFGHPSSPGRFEFSVPLFILHPHRNRYNLDIWSRLLLCKKWHLANTYSISCIENPGSTRHHKS